MKPIEIKIELLEADTWSFIKDRDVPPEGVTIEGPIGTQVCSHGSPPIPPHLLITFTNAAATAVGGAIVAVAKDVLVKKAKKAADWITDYLAKHKAKRTRINKRNANAETMAQIIREELGVGHEDDQIGKGED